MEVPPGQDGIQRLLAAEQEAQAIVAKARQAKAERLKQAKEEAEREIATYKAEREAEFKRKVAEDSSASTENVKQLTAESEGAIKAIQESIRHKEKEVLNLLLGEVTTVKLGANGKK